MADDDGAENLYRIAITGGEVTRPIAGRLVVAYYSLGKDGAIAAQISALDRPDEDFLSNGSDLTRLTKTNDSLFAQLRLAQVDYVPLTRKAGTSISGYLYQHLDY